MVHFMALTPALTIHLAMVGVRTVVSTRAPPHRTPRDRPGTSRQLVRVRQRRSKHRLGSGLPSSFGLVRNAVMVMAKGQSMPMLNAQVPVRRFDFGVAMADS